MLFVWMIETRFNWQKEYKARALFLVSQSKDKYISEGDFP